MQLTFYQQHSNPSVHSSNSQTHTILHIYRLNNWYHKIDTCWLANPTKYQKAIKSQLLHAHYLVRFHFHVIHYINRIYTIYCVYLPSKIFLFVNCFVSTLLAIMIHPSLPTLPPTFLQHIAPTHKLIIFSTSTGFADARIMYSFFQLSLIRAVAQKIRPPQIVSFHLPTTWYVIIFCNAIYQWNTHNLLCLFTNQLSFQSSIASLVPQQTSITASTNIPSAAHTSSNSQTHHNISHVYRLCWSQYIYYFTSIHWLERS